MSRNLISGLKRELAKSKCAGVPASPKTRSLGRALPRPACLLYSSPRRWQTYPLYHNERRELSSTPQTRFQESSREEDSRTAPAPAPSPFAPPEPSPSNWLRNTLIALAVGGALAGFYAWARQQSGDLSLAQYLRTGRELNTTTFVPFTVVSRERITDDTFVLTLRPRHLRLGARVTRIPELAWLSEWSPWFWLTKVREHSNEAVYERAWRHGLWAVEVKQPQLQIVREYTPLPPPPPSAPRETEAGVVDHGWEANRCSGDLRLLVRTVDDGEVSNYLARLRLGSTVELRGPHLGFDVKRRLGVNHGDSAASGGGSGERSSPPSSGSDPRRVVFLAGGTGIAPAMQVAHALLDNGDNGDKAGDAAPDGKPSVSILWANRHRENLAESSPIVRELNDMVKRHGGHLSLQCVVDDEKKFIDEKLVKAAVAAPKGAAAPPVKAHLATVDNTCPYHSETLLQRTATDPPADEGGSCQCPAADGAPAGRNLLFVSGPDGFIRRYAGEKVWRDKLEMQGPVGGLLGSLKQKYPDLFGNWLVLKL